MNNNSCPCCSDIMLRHLSNRHSYWFCSRCRIEMPDIEYHQKAESKIKMNFNSSTQKVSLNVRKPAKPMVSL